jgi:hypothetical protein
MFAGDSQVRMLFRRLVESVSPALGAASVNGENVNTPETFPFYGHKDFEVVWAGTTSGGKKYSTRYVCCVVAPSNRACVLASIPAAISPSARPHTPSSCFPVALPCCRGLFVRQHLVLVDPLRLQHDQRAEDSQRRASEAVRRRPGEGRVVLADPLVLASAPPPGCLCISVSVCCLPVKG